MLLDLNGGVCEVVTGVTVGEQPLLPMVPLPGANFPMPITVYPVLYSPGYNFKYVYIEAYPPLCGNDIL